MAIKPTLGIALLGISVALSAAGQIALKIGVQQVPAIGTIQLTAFFARALASGWVWGGLTSYAVSAVIWLIVLQRIPLGIAYPSLSLGYVIVAVASFLLFGEPVSMLKLLGLSLIIVGVILLSWSF